VEGKVAGEREVGCEVVQVEEGMQSRGEQAEEGEERCRRQARRGAAPRMVAVHGRQCRQAKAGRQAGTAYSSRQGASTLVHKSASRNLLAEAVQCRQQ